MPERTPTPTTRSPRPDTEVLLRDILTPPAEDLRGISQKINNISHQLLLQFPDPESVSSPQRTLESIHRFLSRLPPEQRETVVQTFSRKAELDEAKAAGDVTVNPELTREVRGLVKASGWLKPINGSDPKEQPRLFVTNGGERAGVVGNKTVLVSSSMLASLPPDKVGLILGGTVCHEGAHLSGEHSVRGQLAALLILHHLGNSPTAKQLLSGVSKQLELDADAAAESCQPGGVRAALQRELDQKDPVSAGEPKHPPHSVRLQQLPLHPPATPLTQSPAAEALPQSAMRSIEAMHARELRNATQGRITRNLDRPQLTEDQREAWQKLAQMSARIEIVAEVNGETQTAQIDLDSNNPLWTKEAMTGNRPLHVNGDVIGVRITYPLPQEGGAVEQGSMNYRRTTPSGTLVSSVKIDENGRPIRTLTFGVNGSAGIINFRDVDPLREPALVLLNLSEIGHD